MRESWKYNPFLKILAILFSILFLWGTGISMLIVYLNMQLGFALTEEEFNQYFLNLTEDDRIDDMLYYVRIYLETQNTKSAAQMEMTLRSYQTKFDPDRTNFRFVVKDMENNLLMTNDERYGKAAEFFAQNTRIENIVTQEQSYTVTHHFDDLKELYDVIVNNTMPQYLEDPKDFDIWYFNDTDIHNAYHTGVPIYISDNQTAAVRSFESLESAKKYDFSEEFGSGATVRITAAEGEPEYDEAVWSCLKEELGEKALNTAKYWALIENTIGEPTKIPFTHYLSRKLNGEVMRVADDKLEQKLNNGVDVTITGHHGTGMAVKITTYLPMGLPVADRIRSNYGIFHLVYQYSESIVLTMFGFLILTVICAIAMCSMAGHTRGKEELAISAVHKLPYEYFWILPPVLIFATLGVLSDMYSQATISYRIHAIFAAGMILMISASLVLYLYTTAVRVKSETFWQSFGLVRLLNFITRIFKNRTLTCIMLIVYTVGVIILNMMMVERGGWMRLFVPAIDILSIVGLVYCVYAYFELFRHVRQMESGDFSPVERSLPLVADFGNFDTALGDITSHVGEMVARQTKAEHLRTELITNVSHDLKTPLTSIVNYVDLLSREPMQSEAAAEYLDVLRRQAARLKKLTIDLVDASKASTGNLTVELIPMNLQVLVGQIAGEYEEQLANKELSLVINVPENPVSVLADGRQIWRVFDNLLSNACKYAMPSTRVYLDVRAGETNVTITLKNVSATPLNTSPDELMERFVRGDASRHTEGSGLGLSIARDLTKLQHGTLTLQTDGDLFKAILVFPIYHPPEEETEQTEEV